MGWTTQLVCLGLLAAAVGGAGAHVAWVAGESHFGPHEGRRVARNVGSVNTGTRMVELTIDSDITYRYARTTVVCILDNNNDDAHQIAFKTTLPNTAFISAFHIDVAGHRHVGKVETKEKARQIYDAARAAGKTAAEVELTARDANLFTVSVNVEANEAVTFSLTYDELLVRRLGTYSHAVHIDPGQIVGNLFVKVNIQESNDIHNLNVVPLRPFDATTQSGDDDEEYNDEPLPTVTRPTAKNATIEWSPTPEQQRALKKDGVEGRFVVQYDIDRLSHPNQILVHDGYFVHFYAPADLIPMDKHVVFVLDTSGSMGGTRLTQLKEAMGKILSDLRPGDFFTIIEFSSHIKAWQGSGGGSVDLNLNSAIGEDLVVKATRDKIQQAKTFVQGLAVTGATNIHDSLTIALKAISAGNNKFASMSKVPEPMIVFLTDGDPNEGLVTDKKQIPTAIATTNSKQTSIFSLGFGKGIDMDFLKDLSLKNAGFTRLIYEGSDAALQLEDFYREVSSPLLKNLKFRYTNVDASTVTRVGFNTLHSGTELIMSGKLTGRPSSMRSSLKAKSQNGRYSTGFATPEEVNVASHDFMERLWAYLNIKQLLEDATNAEKQRKAQEMALKYSFVTSLTSLVVVRPDIEDPATSITSINPRFGSGETYDSEDEEGENEAEGDGNDPEPLFHDVRRLDPNGVFEPEPLSLSWASPQFNGTHVVIQKGRKSKTYQVKANPTSENFAACRGGGGNWYHCRHVNACLLPVFVDDVTKYQQSYFCAISGE